MYLISLYFDNRTTKQINKWIEYVAKATKNDFMIKNQVPAHMTIASFEAISEKDARDIFCQISKEMKEAEYSNVLIPSIGILLPYVIYISVIKNDYLSQLNKNINELLNTKEGIKNSKFYMPDTWLPHITIGKTLTEEQLEDAFKQMKKHFQPVEGEIVKISLAKTNPHIDLEVVEI